ncbi:endoribonuclease Dicer homolog 2-like [Rutidosis leptorrhynchoides]|uniref:endoribonuclease Dicer homolog 2-like n=1 Tax=Rutidosis leptorrhynchoides TaxID=125765 RepID=UPI003A99406A
MSNNGGNESNCEVDNDDLSIARSYQIEALEQALKQNTIVFLETGTGKTLIAVMLLRRYAHLLRKPSPFFAVFLVPTVVLVKQQAEAVKKHLGLKVVEFWGDKSVDYWNASDWKKQQDESQLMVMTPVILLDALRHSFLSLDNIKLMIFDECHHAKKNHAYALIMTEFYHRQLNAGATQLPKILGMTASLVDAKGSKSSEVYWKHIKELESVLHSKVYTCANESDLAKYISSSTEKYRFYDPMEVPCEIFEEIKSSLSILRQKHEISIKNSDLSESLMDSAIKRLSTLSTTFEFCLYELGIWLAIKAAEAYAYESNDLFTWGKLDVRGETIARQFCKDANQVFSTYVPPDWKINHNNQATLGLGLLSTKVVCLIEVLAEYRHVNDMRCIIFVERVITAIVLKSLLRELNPKLFGWKTEYTAGSGSIIQSQSRSVQNKIVEEFRRGQVNIIVATSILEEGLDVQSCNVVIRFDLPSTVCSFIQSRGRARKENSDFLLLIKRGDDATLSKVENYLMSGKIMRDESLSHAFEPCEPLNSEIRNQVVYHVESTGATLSLSASLSMVYLYCSRLPSDGYFKPYPRFDIDKQLGTCSIYFPKSCPLPSIHVSSNSKMLKQLACLEACKQLHMIGALTDNLVPVEKAKDLQEIEYDYDEEQDQYVPPELVGRIGAEPTKLYHFYLIKLKSGFDYDIPLQDIVVGVNSELGLDDEGLSFDLEGDKGKIAALMTYIGPSVLMSEQISLIINFQMTVLRVLLDGSLTKLAKSLALFKSDNDQMVFDYLLLPSTGLNETSSMIDWSTVNSVLFPFKKEHNCSLNDHNHTKVHIRNDDNQLRVICSCFVENALVYTPHDGRVYCTMNKLNGLNCNSSMRVATEGEPFLYKSFYKTRYGIDLLHGEESFFAARRLFLVRNSLKRSRHKKEKETSTARFELPSELCYVLMSPISISTFYSFSFVPSIMHRVMSWLIAKNLKKLHLASSPQYGSVPPIKILEAITTRKCLERFHLESFETLGDSFLKYAASQQLFKDHSDQHEGILSARRERIIANDSLCKLGCERNLPGFIRNESFDPKTWVVPGDRSCMLNMEELVLANGIPVYVARKRTIKKKIIADVIEALIGVFLSQGGEMAALSFMGWLGLSADFGNTPYIRELTVQPERFLNIRHVEGLLDYTFRDPSLLVEAFTHASYMLSEIPRCYQRLEFLGDAVLDYLITVHLYIKYPGMSPGLLTDLRSASVNNDCYAQSAVKVELHKHILHGSPDLHRHIINTVQNFDKLSLDSTFGWESRTTFPKVLADVIESLAGAILVDSGYDKELVFKKIMPLLGPLVTPETLKLHPVKELHDLTQKHHYNLKKSHKRTEDGTICFTVEVEAEGHVLKESCMARDKKMGERLASRSVLNLLKEKMAGL